MKRCWNEDIMHDAHLDEWIEMKDVVFDFYTKAQQAVHRGNYKEATELIHWIRVKTSPRSLSNVNPIFYKKMSHNLRALEKATRYHYVDGMLKCDSVNRLIHEHVSSIVEEEFRGMFIGIRNAMVQIEQSINMEIEGSRPKRQRYTFNDDTEF